MKKVDFFIVGFMKSGTTALADFLNQHPDICISTPKEPGYFATDFMKESDEFHGKKVYFKTRTPREYESLFKAADKTQLLGDASTAYIYSKVAAKNIYKYNPGAKIIILMRNPVDFLHALHMQYLNETVENERSFDKALALEKDRKRGLSIPARVRVPSYLFYSERVKYYKQIKRYFDIFPRDQIMVVLHNDFKQNNLSTYREVLKFLGAKKLNFTPKMSGVNASRAPRSKTFHKLINSPYFKNILYRIMGGHLYTKTHKLLGPLLMQKSARGQVDDKTRQSIIKMSKPEVSKASRLADKDLLSLWGYGD